MFRKISNALFVEGTRRSKTSVIGIWTRVVDSSIGEYSYIANNSQVVFTEIGKYTSIGKNVKINLPNHNQNGLTMSPIFDKGDRVFGLKKYQHIDLSRNKVTIGNNVWIGDNVVVTKGLIIGDNVIIGASAVVTKDCVENGIYVGNPARLLRIKEVKETLPTKHWWDMSLEDVFELSKST